MFTRELENAPGL